MTSRVDRQKQIRAQWESENGLIGRRSSRMNRSSEGIKTAIEIEIKDQQEREVVHKQYIESLVKRTNSYKTQTFPPLHTASQEYNHTTTYSNSSAVIPPSPSSSQYSSLSNASSRQSTMEAESSLVSVQTHDLNYDSAFGSQLDFENEHDRDPAYLDEDSFATESLPIDKKKKYWEHKYKKVYDYEKAYLENEKHLQKLRQRKQYSPWNNSDGRNGADSSLTRSMSESSLVSTPTCELIDSHGNILQYNSPKPVVVDLKDHWDEKLSSPVDVPDSLRVAGNDLMKQELKDLKKREKEWSKQQEKQSSSFNYTQSSKHATVKDANINGVIAKSNYAVNGEMKRSQSYCSFNAFSFIPSPENETKDAVKMVRKKPKMLHELMQKGENVIVQIEAREPVTMQNHQYAVRPQIRSSNKTAACGNIPSNIPSPPKNIKFQNELKKHLMKTYPSPRVFSDHQSAIQTGPIENGYKDTTKSSRSKPYPNFCPVLPSPAPFKNRIGTNLTHYTNKLPEIVPTKKDSSNANEINAASVTTTEQRMSSSRMDKKAIKDALRTPTSNVLEKRKSLSKKWDDVCRKSEPKLEF